MDDHYAILRVRSTASKEEIERSYRRLARRYHPDLLRGVSSEARRRAEEQLKRVNFAHGVLADPARRLAYDRERARRAAYSLGAAPARRGAPAARVTPPVAGKTSHWGSGGPIDIEWMAAPARAMRPETDIFSPRRLLRASAAILLFALLLAVLWRPAGEGVAPPAPAPTIAVMPTALPTSPPASTPGR